MRLKGFLNQRFQATLFSPLVPPTASRVAAQDRAFPAQKENFLIMKENVRFVAQVAKHALTIRVSARVALITCIFTPIIANLIVLIFTTNTLPSLFA